MTCLNQMFMKDFFASLSPSLSASVSTMGADIKAPPATGINPMAAGSTLTMILEFLTKLPRLLVKSLTSPVSL